MIKKNIVVTIVEDKEQEPLLDLKSTDNRTDIVLEARIAKIVVDPKELLEAIEIVREFSSVNCNSTPEKENVMEVEMVLDNTEETLI